MSPWCCFPCGGPAIPKLRIHLDADRDGTVDAVYRNLDAWRGGVGQRGAIIVPNVDDDNGNRQIAAAAVAVENPLAGAAGGNTLDGDNDVVDTPADREFTLLAIMRHPGDEDFPAGWSARLSITANRPYIRIFDAAGAVVLGPNHAGPYVLPALGALQVLTMEATQFPGAAPFVDLRLEVLNAGGGVDQTHNARVRVAPWIASHHLMPVNRVFVVGKVGRAAWRQTAAGGPGTALQANREQPMHNQFGIDLTAAVNANNAAAPALTTVLGATYNYDQWFRDVMSVGFTSRPRNVGVRDASCHLNATLRCADDRSVMALPAVAALDRVAWRDVAGVDMGYVSTGAPGAGNNQDSFGNLMCSPPVRVRGVHYPFGRIVYGFGPHGDRPNATVRTFLANQRIQAPFEVDVSWLDVGHVDEAFTFIPMAGGPGFAVVMASPAKAVRTLTNHRTFSQSISAGALATANALPMFPGLPAWVTAAAHFQWMTLAQVLDDAAFVATQTTVQGRLDTIRTVLRTELGLTDGDFIHLPVLFYDTGGGTYEAYTGNLANMLVLTKGNGTVANLIIPKPFGPAPAAVGSLFERQVGLELGHEYAGIGNAVSTYEFVDCYASYHLAHGEIHCGTNEVRTPPVGPWWWDEAAHLL
jgi:protein-arginine deiminase